MSWDKNTINLSQLDAVMEVLEDVGIEYSLLVLDKVVGRGLNDGGIFGDDTRYELRRLEYRNIVYLEEIRQYADCDADDIIYSYKFNKEDEPRNWQTITEIGYEDIE